MEQHLCGCWMCLTSGCSAAHVKLCDCACRVLPCYTRQSLDVCMCICMCVRVSGEKTQACTWPASGVMNCRRFWKDKLYVWAAQTGLLFYFSSFTGSFSALILCGRSPRFIWVSHSRSTRVVICRSALSQGWLATCTGDISLSCNAIRVLQNPYD